MGGIFPNIDYRITNIIMNDKKYWVGFNLIKGIGAVRMQSLVAYFGDLELAWNADPASLGEAGVSNLFIGFSLESMKMALIIFR